MLFTALKYHTEIVKVIKTAIKIAVVHSVLASKNIRAIKLFQNYAISIDYYAGNVCVLLHINRDGLCY